MTTSNKATPNRLLSLDTASAMSVAVERGRAADRAMVAAVDLLVVDGFTKPTDFISPTGKTSDSTCNAEEWQALRGAVIAGFTTQVQGLLEKPTKGLNDKQKTDKRYWQQQIGAKLADFRRAMQKRLDAIADGVEGTPSRTRSPSRRLRDNLNDCLKVIENQDESTTLKLSMTMPAFTTKLKDLISAVK